MKIIIAVFFICFTFFVSYVVPEAAIKNEIILSYDETILVERINMERLKYGVSPLKLDERLLNAAREKAWDLKEKGYFKHSSEKLGTPKDMVENNGIIFYSIGGENIARGRGDVNFIVDAWMKSEGHRLNIIEKGYRKTGIGVIRGDDGVIYCTQLFIG